MLLVRAHIDLIDFIQNPGERPAGERPSTQILAELRRDLDKSTSSTSCRSARSRRSVAGDGGPRARRQPAHELPPSSAETFLLSAILFLKAERMDLAADEVFDAVRMDPKTRDSSILRVYLRWLEVLNDPVQREARDGR